MLSRPLLEAQVARALRFYPVAALLGPRQCGKTTLALQLASTRRSDHFDLEDPISVRRLEEPMSALRPLRGLIIIDEVQRRPDLFPVLRVLADRRPIPARFLILGSASPELLRQSSESLAGRISLIEMSGFSLEEVGAAAVRKLWWRGGFPRSFLASTDAQARDWQTNFIRTFLERDIREFGVQIPAQVLRRLWMMTAHYHGQTGNYADLARSLNESPATVKRHLDLLTGALMVRQLPPWHENLGKREVKAPKLFIRDTGLLHALLDVPSFRMLEGHPKLGASWEGLVIEQLIRIAGAPNAWFWATYAGAELDLLLKVGGRRWGIEVKYADAPAMTKSMRIAMADLKLDRMYVVYPGETVYELDRKVTVVPLARVIADLRKSLGPKS
jgi:predicted AAA+ superfamily ATPase